jgi:hypothetical protein
VRPRPARASDDDYINALYAQPLGTAKRYIDTQCLFPVTFPDICTYVCLFSLRSIVPHVSAQPHLGAEPVVVIMFTREARAP